MNLFDADSVFIILSEDARQEISQRWSFMGMLGPAIEVPALPVIMPLLCCTAVVHEPKKPMTSVEMALHDPDGVVISSAQVELPAPPTEPYTNQAISRFSPIVFTKAGPYRFVVRFDGDPKMTIERRLNVNVKPETAKAPTSLISAAPPK